MYGSVIEQVVWQTGTKQELQELCKTAGLIADIKSIWLVWLVHESRRNETSPAWEIFERKWAGRRIVGKPRLGMMWESWK